MSDPDIIEDFIVHLRKVKPVLSEAEELELEKRLREIWGGIANKPAKRATFLRKARVKVRAEVGTKPDRELIEEHGISRATLYRWIRK